MQGRAWQPLAFFSKKLSPTQARYSTFDRELLATFSAVSHFRFLLEGCRFRILTDYKPLVAAMSRVSPPWSARQQRQMAYLAEFTGDFRHTPGATNVGADALLRPPVPPPRGPSHSSCQPAKSCRRKGSRRRAALRGAISAVESAAHVPGRCRSGIESSRGPASRTSGDTALRGLLARRPRCAASGFCRPCCSTTLLPRCGLNASLHGSLHQFQTNGQASVAWRRIHRRVPPAFAAAVSRRRLSLSPQHCPPRNPSILSSGLLQVLLATPQQAGCRPSQGMSPLSAQQSTQACAHAARAD